MTMSTSASALLSNSAALQKINAQLPTIVSLALVVALGYTMADLGWKLLAPDEAAETQPAGSAATSVKQQPRQNLSNITRSYVFGKENQAVAQNILLLNTTHRGLDHAPYDIWCNHILKYNEILHRDVALAHHHVI